MDFKTIRDRLSKPFAPEDLEWRLQGMNREKTAGYAVPYVTNRAIQDRLDDVAGPENWRNEFRPWHGNGKKDAQICGISIYSEQRKEWITKWDGAEDTDIESVKGGLSDSMKRAAVHWGIGRVLYKMDPVWVDVEPRGSSFVIARKERPKLDKAYLDMLKKLELEPAQPGGLRSQLTPSDDADTLPKQTPAQTNTQTHAQANTQVQPAGTQQRPPQQPAGGNVMPMPTAQRPAYEYIVTAAKIQNGMSGATTSLTLKGQDGKEIRAYRKGACDELVPGAQLYQVKLAVKQQDSVAFYVLESCKVIAAPKQAA